VCHLIFLTLYQRSIKGKGPWSSPVIGVCQMMRHFGCLNCTLLAFICFFFLIHFRCVKFTFIFTSIYPHLATGNHFGCSNFTFTCITHHFRLKNFKLAICKHFGCLKWTFPWISPHFRSKHKFHFFKKWPLVAILDVSNSLLLAFLTISDLNET
jgi:hypothetical protein